MVNIRTIREARGKTKNDMEYISFYLFSKYLNPFSVTLKKNPEARSHIKKRS